MNAEFKDIELKTDGDIKLFRYRKEGILRKYTSIDQDGIRYFAGGTAETQLCRLLGLSVRALEDHAIVDRDKLLSFAIKETRPHPIILHCVGNSVYAVTTELYVTIPHSTVRDITESTLEVFKLNWDRKHPLRTNTAITIRYIFHNGHKDIASGIFIRNSIKATASLSLGRYFEILVCSNGLMSKEQATIYSHVHRGDKKAILAAFSRSLESLLGTITELDTSFAMTTILPNFGLTLEKLPIAKKYKEIIYSDLEIRKIAGEDITLYILANELSRVAHYAPARTRLELERLSYDVITSVENQLGLL